MANRSKHNSHILMAIESLSAIEKVVRKGYAGGSGITERDRIEIDELQERAAEAIGAIEPLLNRFAKRKIQTGSGDLFHEALSVRSAGNLSYVTLALAQLRILKGRLQSDLPSPALAGDPVGQWSNKKVFLVHGHDNDTKQTVARFLEKLGLELVILHERSNRGCPVR